MTWNNKKLRMTKRLVETSTIIQDIEIKYPKETRATSHLNKVLLTTVLLIKTRYNITTRYIMKTPCEKSKKIPTEECKKWCNKFKTICRCDRGGITLGGVPSDMMIDSVCA